MTQPNQEPRAVPPPDTARTPDAPPQLQVATQLVPGPDGKPIVVLLLGQGNLGIQVTVDWDRSDAFGEYLHQKLREAGEQGRRISTGLLVADASQLPKINGTEFRQ